MSRVQAKSVVFPSTYMGVVVKIIQKSITKWLFFQYYDIVYATCTSWGTINTHHVIFHGQPNVQPNFKVIIIFNSAPFYIISTLLLVTKVFGIEWVNSWCARPVSIEVFPVFHWYCVIMHTLYQLHCVLSWPLLILFSRVRVSRLWAPRWWRHLSPPQCGSLLEEMLTQHTLTGVS